MTFLVLYSAMIGVLSMYLLGREKIYYFPVGIANMFITIGLGIDTRLYAQSPFPLFVYVPILIWGWYQWLTDLPKNSRGVAMTNDINRQQVYVLVPVFVIFSALYGYWLYMFRPGSHPFIEAPASVLIMIALLLIANKTIQAWLVLVAADIISLSIYWYKDFSFTSISHGIFLLLAIKGYYSWRYEKDYFHRKTQKEAPIIATV